MPKIPTQIVQWKVLTTLVDNLKDYLPFISSRVGVETSYIPTSCQIQTNVETVVIHRLPMAVAKKKLLNQFIISFEIS